MRRLFGLAVLISLFCVGVWSSPRPEAKKHPKADSCESVCYTYRQLVSQERDTAEKDGYRYFSPIALKTPLLVAHYKVLDLHSNYSGAIDDRLWFDVNGDNPEGKNTIRRVVYPARSGEFKVFTSELKKGANAIALRYANDAGPDGNFSLSLGGMAFCPKADDCKRFDENYGTPHFAEVTKQHGGSTFGWGDVVPLGKLWLSKVELPPAKCTCQDP